MQFQETLTKVILRMTSLILNVNLFFQNDLENVLPFVLISAMYITTNPALSCAKIVFRVWTLARYIHTFVYVFQVSKIQVNLCQKHSFLNQLTHNMTTDCSLITDFSTRKIQVENMLCIKIVFCICFGIQNNFSTQRVLNLYFSCTEVSNQ